MTRSILSGLLGLLSVVAVGSLPTACESGGVGDPCLPEDEYSAQFAGFKVTEENIESRSFQCQTRICLVNHFQGRVSCPLGQDAPTSCNPADPAPCTDGRTCVLSAEFAAPCTSSAECQSGSCDPNGGFCQCNTSADCPQDGSWFCDGADKRCKTYVCHQERNCQVRGVSDAENLDSTGQPKDCCVPGTDIPVASPVCGQCEASSTRNAEKSVYCSCRCGVAEGEADDPNFNFCECPQGFTCSEIRKNVGLGDEKITGKYCIKQGTEWVDEQQCGSVNGYFDPNQCKGLPGSL
jgi:hypothetical protein